MGVLNYLRNRLWHDIETRKAQRSLSEMLSEVRRLEKQVLYDQIVSRFHEKTMSSTEPGTTSSLFYGEEVIVSLTTFGTRINDVYLTIESIMQGSLLPNRIILWLAEDEFRDKPLPLMLLKQQKRGLQIEYCKDLRSYKKLIPTLKTHPLATIITIDDDVIYDFDMLERFLNAHRENPHAICASRVRRISVDNEGRIGSYLTWKVDTESTLSKLLFPIGVGGILYPPNSLSNEVNNESVFMDICRFADDVWFFSMARLNGTTTVRVPSRNPQGYYFELPSSSYKSLAKENINPDNCRNDLQIQSVFDRYSISHYLFSDEH